MQFFFFFTTVSDTPVTPPPDDGGTGTDTGTVGVSGGTSTIFRMYQVAINASFRK